MIDLAFRNYHPATAVIHPAVPSSGSLVPPFHPSVASYLPVNGKATAYVCRDFRCELPVTDPVALGGLLRQREWSSGDLPQ
jgi:uncharacterized protein YyaL (SSP411 family)